MARILNTRVIYGVRQGFFNGKEPEFSPDLQPPFFTTSDYEENRILLLVDPKTQPQVTAKIYRIPVAKPKKKQKSFDLITINKINSEKDIKLKLKIAENYIRKLSAVHVGNVVLTIDDVVKHSTLVASADKEAQEINLANKLNNSIFLSDKNIILKVLGVRETAISASGLKRIERISGVGGADFYFKDKKGKDIPNFKFSYKHKSQNSLFERYKGFMSYLKNKIKTNKQSELSKKFKDFYQNVVRYYSYASLSSIDMGQVYEEIDLSEETIKEEFIQFLYGVPRTDDHYNFILISNTDPKFEIDSESPNDTTYILKTDSDQVVYVYPEIPEGDFTPYLVARPGPHGTKVELLSRLDNIISDIRFFISPQRRAKQGQSKKIDSGLLEILETIPKELNDSKLEERILELTNKNFTNAIQTIGLDEPTTTSDSMQEHQKKNLHIITELRCLYYSLFE